MRQIHNKTINRIYPLCQATMLYMTGYLEIKSLSVRIQPFSRSIFGLLKIMTVI